ncbi:polysaccharide deacetylase family protein [Streptomyces sp. NPDC001922]|uniref:polysaccharide deacetylase family protein n=1 Tax=Streptomyces sp. NPDC001922 TaxID=3364624 RepID=UPI0036A7CA5C
MIRTAGLLALALALGQITATSAAAAPPLRTAAAPSLSERAALSSVRAAAPSSAGGISSSSAAGYDITRCGNTSGRVLLTLDDWSYSDPYRATRVGTYLRDRGVRAAFFLVNEFARDYPDIVTTLREQGHWVANHSYAHRQLTGLSDDEVAYEIENGLRSNVLRPPYGDFGAREESIAETLGYRMCTWTVDTLDWERTGDDYRSVTGIRSIVRDASPADKHGGVVLGHLDYHFPDALPGIIDDLTEEGYGLCLNDGAVGASMPLPLDCD